MRKSNPGDVQRSRKKWNNYSMNRTNRVKRDVFTLDKLLIWGRSLKGNLFFFYASYHFLKELKKIGSMFVFSLKLDLSSWMKKIIDFIKTNLTKKQSFTCFPKSYEPHQYKVINKKIQTTSTKCQYQAPASKPKWCCRVKWYWVWRHRLVIKKMVPTKTWKPWKPVVK